MLETVVAGNGTISPNFNLPTVGITFNEIEADVAKHIQAAQKLVKDTGLFVIKTANQWMEQAMMRPKPCMLFSEFWFEGEICCLFADTNTGKSILAVQIADSISRGIPMPGFKLGVPARKVLYCDFELSDKQFEQRYSDGDSQHHRFHDNLSRVEINPDANLPPGKTFDDHLIEELERNLVRTGTKILIIDNITYLKEDTEKAKEASPLMKRLKGLKSKHSLSILVLAHTPKRDTSRPIEGNNLAGSRMLMNFMDSAIAIGQSHDSTNYRYLKQIKERAVEKIYGSGNVCVCQIVKEDNFLQFKFLEYGIEDKLLRQQTAVEENDTLQQLILLHSQGESLRTIGDKMHMSHVTVKRLLDRHNNNTETPVTTVTPVTL